MREIAMVPREGLTWLERLRVARRRVPEVPMLIRRHGSWWQPDASGYTTDLARAGIYSPEFARCCLDVDGLSVVPASDVIEAEIAAAEARLTALRELRAAAPCR